MSWSRFDDNWSDKMRARGLSFQTRVHYMTLIQYCSRTNLPGSEGLVTRDVTRDVGTGQDGPRSEGVTSEKENPVANPVGNPPGFSSGRVFPLTPVPDDLCPQCAEQPGDCTCAA